MVASTATEPVRPRPGGRSRASGPDRATVLLLTMSAFLGVLSMLARELERSEPRRIAAPVVVTRRVYETRVIETVPARTRISAGGTSVTQSTSSSGPVSAGTALSTRTS